MSDDASRQLHTVGLDGHSWRMALPQGEADVIQEELIRRGRPYELDLVRDVLRQVPPGALVLDIGANVGNHSLAWAVAGDLDVMAYEPNPDLASAIEVSAQASGVADRVIVHAVALSDHEGQERLVGGDQGNAGAAHLDPAATEGTNVPVRVLTDPGRPVAAIKVDVEGSEAAVLRGAVSLLQSHQPLLYVECLDAAAFTEVWQVLQPLGYAYETTFNASPTHRFRWGPGKADAAGPLMGLMSRFYADHDAYVHTRSQLQVANRKYREVTSSMAEMRERMAQLESAAPAPDQEVLTAHRQVADAMAMVRDLEAQMLARTRTAREWAELLDERDGALAAARDHSAATEQRLQRRVDELEQRLVDATSRATASESALDDATRRVSSMDQQLAERSTLVASQAAELERLTREHGARQEELRQVRAEADRAGHARAASDARAASLEAEMVRLAGRLVQAWERAALEVDRSRADAVARPDAPRQVARKGPTAEDLAYLRSWHEERLVNELSARQKYEGALARARKFEGAAHELQRANDHLQGRVEKFREEAQGLHDRRRVERAEARAVAERLQLAQLSNRDAHALRKQQLAQARREHREQLAAVQESLDALRQQLQENQERADELERERAALRSELTGLRRSATYRVGVEVRRTRGPVSLFSLPWRMVAAGRSNRGAQMKEIEQ